jgi:multisubunit Na+/H+ antiporter MnhE subunit
MKYEPVAILDFIKYLIGFLAIVGVWQFDSASTDWVVGIAGIVLALITSFVTRRSVFAPATVERIQSESVR